MTTMRTDDATSSRPRRIAFGTALVVLALIGLVGTLPQILITYYLPAAHGPATEHSSVFAPAVAAAIVTGVILVLLVVHLIGVVRRPAPRVIWIVAACLAVVGLATPFMLATMSRPVF